MRTNCVHRPSCLPMCIQTRPHMSACYLPCAACEHFCANLAPAYQLSMLFRASMDLVLQRKHHLTSGSTSSSIWQQHLGWNRRETLQATSTRCLHALQLKDKDPCSDKICCDALDGGVGLAAEQEPVRVCDLGYVLWSTP